MPCTMRITHELRYDAPPSAVYAMLADPAFREEVGKAMDVARQDISIDRTAEGMDVRIDMDQRTQGIPSFARRIVGDRTRVVQSERWEHEEGADLQLQIPGKPGHIRGRITLSETDDGSGGTVESFDGEAVIKVPFVGGRLEGLIEKLFTAGMDTEQSLGERWLTGDRA